MAPLPPAHQPNPDRMLDVARVEPLGSEVLGPRLHAVAWMQGCALRCRGCVVPESHPRGAGRPMTPEELAVALMAVPLARGLTLSGGEPFLQSRGLTETLAIVRAECPDWTFMSYTGYRLETLRDRGAASQLELLAQLDILVDGPFVESRADMLLWRGSSNQRLVALTARGAADLAGREDAWAGIEVTVDGDGRLSWTGVPPVGFRAALDEALAQAGLVATHTTTERSAR